MARCYPPGRVAVPVFIAAVAAAMLPGVARAEGPLSMEEAVRLALANNERSLKAPLRVATAEGQLDRARAAFFPTIAAGGTGTYAFQADRSGRNLSGTGQVQLNQPIFNLPAFPLYAQARHELESQKWGAAEDRRQLAFDTARAYVVGVSSEHLVDAAQRRLDRAVATQQDTQARVDAQLASTNDATRAQVDTATAQTQVLQAKGTLERAYARSRSSSGATSKDRSCRRSKRRRRRAPGSTI
jgi:outer membrane protein TolC